jgi:capsular polysaccharide biosynthesis protein
MNNQTKLPLDNNEIEIDLLHLVKILWQKAWMIALCALLLGAITFSYAFFFITPQYQAKAMMYVNNNALSLGGTSVSISASEITAARSLLDTYVIILKSRTTMEQVLEQSGLDYSYSQIASMVDATPVNSTEVFQITATCADPAEAELIVDTIVTILPDRIADIVDGSSVRLVDRAVLPTARFSPSYSRYAMIGLLLGFVLSCGYIIVVDLMDTTIRDEDYLYQRYSIPVLAVVPDAYDTRKGSYSHYYRQDTPAENKENQ